jgi:hypothetical protein
MGKASRRDQFRLQAIGSFAFVFALAVLPLHAAQAAKAGQTAKKVPAKSPARLCAYASHLFPARTFQVHGLSCQECSSAGQWMDVGGQECDQHPAKVAPAKSGKPEGHLCAKDDGNYSVGAIYAGADDCSRCTERAAPDDWDALEKMYFCEKLNSSGDVD